MNQIVIDCKGNLPVLSEIKEKIINDESLPTNIFIEGDNYHVVSVLNYTRKGKIEFDLGNEDAETMIALIFYIADEKIIKIEVMHET